MFFCRCSRFSNVRCYWTPPSEKVFLGAYTTNREDLDQTALTQMIRVFTVCLHNHQILKIIMTHNGVADETVRAG